MKFTRRHDVDPPTRIEIVKDVWLHQGIYGKMTQIAQQFPLTTYNSYTTYVGSLSRAI